MNDHTDRTPECPTPESGRRERSPAGRVTRVVVADADLRWAKALRKAAPQVDFSVHGTARSALAWAAAGEERCDLMLVSMSLPDMDGFRCIAAAKDLFPAADVAVALPLEEAHTLLNALCAGACGYLLKNARPADLALVLDALLRRQPMMGSAVAERLLDLIGELSSNGAAARVLPVRLGFSFEEFRFLQMLAYRAGDPAAVLRNGAGEGNELLDRIIARLQSPPLAGVVPVALRASMAVRYGRTLQLPQAVEPRVFRGPPPGARH